MPTSGRRRLISFSVERIGRTSRGHIGSMNGPITIQTRHGWLTRNRRNRRTRVSIDQRRRAVAHDHLRLRVPSECKFCQTIGFVVPEVTIAAGIVSLTWCCRACSKEWPVSAAEQGIIDRRRVANDRRRLTRTRKDRRASP